MPSIQGQIIGTHDTGWFDRQDYLRVGSRLAQNLDAQAALARARQNPGAELLVRTSGPPAPHHQHREMQHYPSERYDVYSLSVVDARQTPVPGKPLQIADLLSAVTITPELHNRLEDPQSGIIPAGLTLCSADQQLVDLKWKGGSLRLEHFYALAVVSAQGHWNQALNSPSAPARMP